MTNEEIISNFLQTAYTDEKLAALLAHAEDGKFSFQSCCCLIGIPTADHAIRGSMPDFSPGDEPHYQAAKRIPGADGAEYALLQLGMTFGEYDEGRMRVRFLPLIKAEMARRETQRATVRDYESVAV